MTTPSNARPSLTDVSIADRALTRRALLGKAATTGAAALVGATLTLGSASAQTSSNKAVTTANLNMRSGPSTQYAILRVVPKGATVTVNNRGYAGYISVTYAGTTGYVLAIYLSPAGSTPPDPVIIGSARTTANVNLRSGPSTSNQVLHVVPRSATVQISGTVRNGFRYVIHNGLAGWIADQYLVSDVPGDCPYDPNFATTTAALNLRAALSLSARVLLVMPSGARVRLLEGGSGQFRKVSYNGTVGWAAYAYLN